MKHYIITRVTLDMTTDFIESFRLREKIFKEKTLPSLLGQTNKGFEWICLIHPDTPLDIIDLFKEHAVIIITTLETWMSDIKEYIEHDAIGEAIITTRFDTDDILDEEFVDLIQKTYTENPGGLLAFTHGAEIDNDTGKVYDFVKEYSNPFISLYETVRPIKTVHQSGHGKMGVLYECNFVYTKKPMRYRILHGSNLDRKKVLGSLKELVSDNS